VDCDINQDKYAFPVQNLFVGLLSALLAENVLIGLGEKPRYVKLQFERG
jgi:hypothetical protein